MTPSEFVYLSRVWAGSQVWKGFTPRTIRPVAAILNLTENCQAKCVTCDYWKQRWQDHISTDQAVDLIDRLGEVGVRYLRFTGGEPLLRLDLFDILKRANTKPFERITLQTNGLLLKKLHKQINDSPITKVSISVDALDETNDAIRGIKGYFRLAMEGADLLVGKKLQITTTLTAPGSKDMDALMAMVRSRGWGFGFNLLDNRLYFFQNTDVMRFWPNAEETDANLSAIDRRLTISGFERQYTERYYRGGGAHDGLEEPPCALGYIELVITSNGDVRSGCNVLPPLGNVLKDDIGAILARPEYRERCAAMLRRECPGCTCGVFLNLKLANAFKWFSHRATHQGAPAKSIPLTAVPGK